MPRSSPPTVLRPWQVVCLLLAVACTRAVLAGSAPLDPDALIELRYAGNLAAGSGLTFNPGAGWEELPVTASFGYVLLLAAGGPLGLSPLRGALGANLAFDLASAALILALWRASPLRAALGVLLFALLPSPAQASVGASAAPALGAAALLATWAVARGRLVIAGLACALATSLRPEATWLLLALAPSARSRPGGLRRLLVPAALALSGYVAALVLLWRVPLAEAPLLGLRAAEGGTLLSAGAATLGRALAPDPVALACLPLALLGAPRLLRERDPAAPFVVFALALLATLLFARPEPAAAPLVVVQLACGLAAASGLEALWLRFAGRARARLSGAVPAAVALVVALAALGARSSEDRITSRVYRPLAVWAEESGFAADHHRLLTTRVGPVGFFAGGVVLDAAGQLWPREARRLETLDAIADLRPEYLLLRTAGPQLESLREREDLARAYYPIQRFSVEGETELEPALEQLSELPTEDWLLFRHRF